MKSYTHFPAPQHVQRIIGACVFERARVCARVCLCVQDCTCSCVCRCVCTCAIQMVLTVYRRDVIHNRLFFFLSILYPVVFLKFYLICIFRKLDIDYILDEISIQFNLTHIFFLLVVRYPSSMVRPSFLYLLLFLLLLQLCERVFCERVKYIHYRPMMLGRPIGR